MQAFLQNYGLWIVLGIIVVWLLFRLARGRQGCHTSVKATERNQNDGSDSSHHGGCGCC